MIRNFKKEMFMNKYAHEHQIMSTLDAWKTKDESNDI